LIKLTASDIEGAEMLNKFLEKADEVVGGLAGWVVAPFHNRSDWGFCLWSGTETLLSGAFVFKYVDLHFL
jgi:hypothetical protein